MEILPNMDLWERKTLSNSGSYQEGTDLFQGKKMTADPIFMKTLPKMYLGTTESPLKLESHLESADLSHGPTISPPDQLT